MPLTSLKMSNINKRERVLERERDRERGSKEYFTYASRMPLTSLKLSNIYKRESERDSDKQIKIKRERLRVCV